MFSKGIPHYTLLYHMDRVAKLCSRADQVRNMPAYVDTGASKKVECNIYNKGYYMCLFLGRSLSTSRATC